MSKIGEPVGKLIDVNGHKIHVHSKGEGGPTVWLENGWAAVSIGWEPFHSMLAQHIRVCAYDRAGIGWSEPNGIDRSAQAEANEFAELLDAMGETDPIILVAWSGGGPVAQIFAADHPERVAGLVLIDAIPPAYHPWVIKTFPNRFWQESQTHLEDIRSRAEKAAKGELKFDDIHSWFTQSILDEYGELYKKIILNNPHYWWTYYWENQFIITSGRQVESKVTPTDMPLKVLIASQLPEDRSVYRQSQARMWQTMQQGQAALSTKGEALWIDAGHAIFREKPQAVINAVLDIIALM